MQTKLCVIQVTGDDEAKQSGPGNSQQNGKPYQSWSQVAYLWNGSSFPLPISIRFDVLAAAPGEKNFLPLAPGFYCIPAGAFYVRQGQLQARFDSAPVPVSDAISDLQELVKASRAPAGRPAPVAVGG